MLLLAVSSVGARRSELTELVSDHVLGHVDLHVRPTVVDVEGVANKLWA